ncbi:MAG: SRPBCC family protein [Tannerella sp.]|jgi:carbon monoxide dehydrogenase subunit G|nr:SRPBCC family protein [Tannerella sp.]
MADFTSEIKTIPHSDEKVFTLLSDLSNLERLKAQIPQDKISDFTFDSDTCSFNVAPVGRIEFKIIEREPNKTIKLMTTNSPVHLQMWIQLRQVAENDTRMKMTVRAELNAFLKPMVSKPLQEAVNRISDVIAQLPY